MEGIPVAARPVAALLGAWRTGSDDAVHEALTDALRVVVLDGRVPVGARLPAERDLAAALGVSRSTVARAYAGLRGDGYLASRRGSGSVVLAPPAEREAADPGEEDGLLDLRRASLRAAPGILEATERAMTALPGALAQLGYDAVGDPGLRAAIADRYTTRGLPTRPEQVMVTLGALHAVALLARVLVPRGARVLLESPTYPHALAAVRQAGGRPVVVPVDGDAGWDEDVLLAALQRARPALAYLMPDLHNPTGATMPPAVRSALLAAAAEAGTVVVADETIAELRIDGRTEPPLAALGPAVMIGSASKVFWGALRIGWIRAEPDLLERLRLARSSGDLGTPLLEQLVVRELVPTTDAVLRQRRAFLREGRDEVVAALRTAHPGWRVPSPEGGLVSWVRLDRPVSARLVLAARREGVLLASGGSFGPLGGFDRFLRVPFSRTPAERQRMLDALGRAAAALGEVEGHDAPSAAPIV